MKKISTKLYISFFITFISWHIGWILSNSLQINNTQEETSILNTIIPIFIWIFLTCIAFIFLYFKTKQIDKEYKNIDNITDKGLIDLSKTTLNLPIYVYKLYFVIFVISVTKVSEL